MSNLKPINKPAPPKKSELDEFGREIAIAIAFTVKEKTEQAVERAGSAAGKLWKEAYTDVMRSNQTPHAYERTGALGDIEVPASFPKDVSVAPFSDILAGTTLRFVIKLQDQPVEEAHRVAQQPLTNDQASEIKHWRKESDAEATSLKPPPYPAITAPNFGVVGSMFPIAKDHSYLLPYLLVGPNDINQPIVYRNLGNRYSMDNDTSSSGGSMGGPINTRRDPHRGEHLLNSFLEKLHCVPLNDISAKKTSYDTTVESGFIPGKESPFDVIYRNIAEGLGSSRGSRKMVHVSIIGMNEEDLPR